MTDQAATAPRTARHELIVGLSWLAVLICAWTGFHLMARVGIQNSLSGYDLTTLRLTIGGLVLGPIVLRLGFAGLKWWQIAILAAFGGPGFALFAFSGYQFAPTVHGGAIMTGTIALFTAPLAWLLAGERLNRMRTIALFVILAGAGVLILDALTDSSSRAWIGDILFLTASANWSLFAVLMRRWRVTPVRAASIIALFSLIFYLPIHLTVFPITLHLAPLREVIIQALFQGLFVSLVSVLGFGYAARALGVTVTSMCVAIVPGAVAVLAFVLLGEPLTAMIIAGVVLVTIGILGMVAGSRPPAGGRKTRLGPMEAHHQIPKIRPRRESQTKMWRLE